MTRAVLASNVVIVGVGNVGFAVAEQLAKTHKVHLVDCRLTDDIAKLVASGASFSEVDATDAGAMQQELSRVRKLWDDSIHALVVTVGGYSTATPLTEFQTFKAIFDLNVFGVLMPIKACLAVNDGSPCRMVVLSSTSGHHAPATLDAYAPSKWALENLCGAIGSELHGTGSTLDVLCPTNLRNVRSKDFLTERGLAPAVVAKAIRRTLTRDTRRAYRRRYLPFRYRGVHALERATPWVLDLAAGVPWRRTRGGRNRVALITGASTGLGRELARRYAHVTDELILTARTASALQDLKAEIEASTACRVRIDVIDMSDLDAVGRFATSLPDVELLINNAGTHVTAHVADTGKEIFEKTFAVNFFASVILTAACLSRSGKLRKIVNVLSTTAIAGRRDLGAYSASKGALWAFTRSLLRVVGREVEVMEVLPATFASDLAKKGLRVVQQKPAAHAKASSPPQAKVLTSSEVADRIFAAEQKGQRRISMPVEAGMLLWMELVAPRVFVRIFQR